MHETAWSSGSGGSCTFFEGPSEVIVSNTVRGDEILLAVSINQNGQSELQ